MAEHLACLPFQSWASTSNVTWDHNKVVVSLTQELVATRGALFLYYNDRVSAGGCGHLLTDMWSAGLPLCLLHA